MPIQQLSIGVLTPLLQNVIYALPNRRCFLFGDGTSPTFQHSTDPAFSTNVALTLTNGQVEVGGGFIRCTSATPGNVILSRS